MPKGKYNDGYYVVTTYKTGEEMYVDFFETLKQVEAHCSKTLTDDDYLIDKIIKGHELNVISKEIKVKIG